ncbi:MAG: acetylglutamate kinase [Phycisphaerales bacterium]|nr:acetylglutamate kinase [Phycisphaerales bacterium]
MSDAPIVVKLGGRALDEASSRPALWDALATLAKSAPGGLVLVHGGGGAVDAHLARLGLTSERRAGLRVTPESEIAEVVAVLRGVVNTQLVGLLEARGAPSAGLGLSDGGACRCEKHAPDGIDLGRVGRVAPRGGADGALWRTLLGAGVTPVLSSIGLDHMGRPLNVNADDAALGVAQILCAGALVLLTDVPGILDGDKRLIEEIDTDGIESLIASGVISGGMIPKARAAAGAAEASGVPTIIASWDAPERLAPLASGGRAGTRVVSRRRRPVGSGT